MANDTSAGQTVRDLRHRWKPHKERLHAARGDQATASHPRRQAEPYRAEAVRGDDVAAVACGVGCNEGDWEKARRPYYNMWPSIIPMLPRLNLDLDSDMIQLPLPALCIRFPKDLAKNPLKFE